MSEYMYTAVLKLSLLMNMLKNLGAISHINAKLKIIISDTFSVSIIRVDVFNDHTSLLHIPVRHRLNRVVYDHSAHRP